MLAARASITRQIALNTRKLSPQPQVQEPKAQRSNSDGINKDTDASDYVLVSEDETAR